jgi:hypothetical protein
VLSHRAANNFVKRPQALSRRGPPGSKSIVSENVASPGPRTLNRV